MVHRHSAIFGMIAACGLLATASCEPFTGTGGTGAAADTSATNTTSGSSCGCAPGDHTTGECVMGACQYTCDAGFADCDTDPATCEVDVTKNGNCGACGVQCATECLADLLNSKCNDPVEITAGTAHTCALRQDGSVWCWGSNEFGQVGIGSGAVAQFVPAKVPVPFQVAHVVANGLATCALGVNAKLACWGGDGTPMSVPLTYTSSAYEGAVEVSVGPPPLDVGPDSLLIQGGSAAVQQFQISSNMDPAAMSPLVGAAHVSAGGQHACAADVSGTVRCWGNNYFGQLGQGMFGSTGTSPPVVVPNVKATSIVAGTMHTCARTTSGEVRCWGGNSAHQAGGTTSPVPSPQTVSLPGNVAADEIAAGASDSAAIARGQLYLWGSNADYQVSTSGMDEPFPVAYLGLGKVARVALGDNHTCVLLATGAIQCWGRNDSYQLGDGTQNDSPIPVNVLWP